MQRYLDIFRYISPLLFSHLVAVHVRAHSELLFAFSFLFFVVTSPLRLGWTCLASAGSAGQLILGLWSRECSRSLMPTTTRCES